MDVDVSPSNGFSQVYNSMNNSLSSVNPLVLIILSLVIIFYFLVFSYLGFNNKTGVSAPQTPGMRVIEIIMWGLLIFLVLINGLQYFFKIDVNTAIKNLFSGKPEVDIKIKPEEKYLEKKDNNLRKGLKRLEKGLENELEKDLGLANLSAGGQLGSKQVFNVRDNVYTYDEADALCQAYGGKLATYDQIENAYKSGAEWCNYGWSANQMALYPTQKTTWHKLQKIKGHEHDCGRPGINGGYIRNPNVRFGVNCYGNKPNITNREQKIMDETTPYPETEEDRKIDKMVKHYKKKLKKILISPFNYNSWSQL